MNSVRLLLCFFCLYVFFVPFRAQHSVRATTLLTRIPASWGFSRLMLKTRMLSIGCETPD